MQTTQDKCTTTRVASIMGYLRNQPHVTLNLTQRYQNHTVRAGLKKAFSTEPLAGGHLLPKALQPIAQTHVKQHDIYQALLSLKFSYFAQFEDTEQDEMLVLCGLYRIRKHKRTQKVKFERLALSLSTPKEPTRWVTVRYLPDIPLPLVSTSSAGLFHSVAQFIAKEWMKDLEKQGVTHLNVLGYVQYERWHDNQQSKSTWTAISLAANKAALSLANQLVVAKQSKVSIANRGLAKYLWRLIDKRKYGLFLKTQPCWNTDSGQPRTLIVF